MFLTFKRWNCLWWSLVVECTSPPTTTLSTPAGPAGRPAKDDRGRPQVYGAFSDRCPFPGAAPSNLSVKTSPIAIFCSTIPFKCDNHVLEINHHYIYTPLSKYSGVSVAAMTLYFPGLYFTHRFLFKRVVASPHWEPHLARLATVTRAGSGGAGALPSEVSRRVNESIHPAPSCSPTQLLPT